MQQLNLPAYDHKLKHSAEKSFIYDIIRRKYVALTPEEWVRQHMIHYLILNRQYPKSLLAVERGLSYNQLAKRTDVCLYGNNALPLMLIECKASHVAISSATVQQAIVYNKTLKANYLVLTNGLNHFCWEVNRHTGHLKPLSEIPLYHQLKSGKDYSKAEEGND